MLFHGSVYCLNGLTAENERKIHATSCKQSFYHNWEGLGSMSYSLFVSDFELQPHYMVKENPLKVVWTHLICCIVYPQVSVCVWGSSWPGWSYSSSLPPSFRGFLFQHLMESSPVWSSRWEAFALLNLTVSVPNHDKPPTAPNRTISDLQHSESLCYTTIILYFINICCIVLFM